MKRAIRKCCGTCKHWGVPGQKDEWRECQDDLPSPLSTAAHHGCNCPDWKSKRPARKPAPFRRWSYNQGSAGQHSWIVQDGATETQVVLADGYSPTAAKALVRALNRHRVVLPKGRGK